VWGLHLSSWRDCKIPDTSKPQRNGRKDASPLPDCKLRENRRLWTARKKWRETVRRKPCLQKCTHVRAGAYPLVNPKKTRGQGRKPVFVDFRRRINGRLGLVQGVVKV
jgi:hypothetical protein